MWWAIDRKLDADATRKSAAATILDCIRMGVTSIFDHHASYGEIPGSLFAIAEEARRLGMRCCLCYEVSDRDGAQKCAEAIRENGEFARYAAKDPSDMVKAMFGLHAPFTLSDATLDRCVRENDGVTGFHVHVSEGMDDVYDSLRNHGRRPVQRLAGSRDPGPEDDCGPLHPRQSRRDGDPVPDGDDGGQQPAEQHEQRRGRLARFAAACKRRPGWPGDGCVYA